MKLVHKASIVAIVAVGILNAYIYNYDLLSLSECRFPSNSDIKILAFGDPQIRGTNELTPLRQKIDIRGNYLYLSHIFNVMMSRLHPEYVAVMGDLLSSQWINDVDFHRRSNVFASVFNISAYPNSEIFNVSGNHDIGYAGELNRDRMARFVDRYGQVNFVYKVTDNIRIVVLNSLNVDGPVLSEDYFQDTMIFLHENSQWPGYTILLTHIPLYKPEGICTDGPYFAYYNDGTLREQNHLSNEASQKVLNSLFDPSVGKGGVVVTGHDHEGCVSKYYYNPETDAWNVFEDNQAQNSAYQVIEEFTVRSMMGEYGGNTGLLSLTTAPDGTVTFTYTLCPFAVQHIWWITKIGTPIVIFITALFLFGYSIYQRQQRYQAAQKMKQH